MDREYNHFFHHQIRRITMLFFILWLQEKQLLSYTRRVQPKMGIKLGLNSLDDFVPLGNMQPVDDVVGFFTSRGKEFSVYTIDWEQEAVVFVRPLDGADTKDHPFFREAQRRTATEVLSIPFSHLQDAVDAIRHKVAHVQNVFVYMTARCGSTLLTRAVDATSFAQAASEPDIFSVIGMAVIRSRRSRQNKSFSLIPAERSATASDEDDMVELLKNVVNLLNYHLMMADPRHRDVIMYKLRTYVLLIGDLMFRAFPSAKNIFLYRNGMEYLQSWNRLWFRSKVVYSLVRQLVRLGLWRWAPMEPDYFRCFGEDAIFSDNYDGSSIFYSVTSWVGAMQRALELQKMDPGYFFHCLVYYSALATGKDKSLRLVLKRLGLKWNPAEHSEEAEKMKKVFMKDSQAGTLFSTRIKNPGEKWTKPSPTSWLGDWDREYMSIVCKATGNDILGPDFIFPDTLL
ncbi:uncharacterized protein LOC144868355 [Branchiostoma floridae x Branchiostoma japonicum]